MASNVSRKVADHAQCVQGVRELLQTGMGLRRLHGGLWSETGCCAGWCFTCADAGCPKPCLSRRRGPEAESGGQQDRQGVENVWKELDARLGEQGFQMPPTVMPLLRDLINVQNMNWHQHVTITMDNAVRDILAANYPAAGSVQSACST